MLHCANASEEQVFCLLASGATVSTIDLSSYTRT